MIISFGFGSLSTRDTLSLIHIYIETTYYLEIGRYYLDNYLESDPSALSGLEVSTDEYWHQVIISGIYDTVVEKLMEDSTEEIICTGTRAGDMALRIYYGGFTRCV